MVQKEDCYVLVYFDGDGLTLFDIGGIDFIVSQHCDYVRKVEEFIALYDGIPFMDLPNEYHENLLADHTNIDRFCVLGYRNGKIKCVCGEYPQIKKKKSVTFY